MDMLDLKHFQHITAETCLASYDGGNKQLRYLAVIDGNVASYKVKNGKKVLYEGESSVRAAEVYNEALAA